MNSTEFEGWPPQIGSFVAVFEAENEREVAALFRDGAIRAWNLGKIKRAWVEDEVAMVELFMYGTAVENTLTGKYGPARQARDGTWYFSVSGKDSQAVRRKYTWTECRVFDFYLTAKHKIPRETQQLIEEFLNELQIPVEQEVTFV